MITIHNHSLHCEACKEDRQHIVALEEQIKKMTKERDEMEEVLSYLRAALKEEK